MQQQAINAGKHTLEIENRARLVATGVKRVDFFSGELITAQTAGGPDAHQGRGAVYRESQFGDGRALLVKRAG